MGGTCRSNEILHPPFRKNDPQSDGSILEHNIVQHWMVPTIFQFNEEGVTYFVS